MPAKKALFTWTAARARTLAAVSWLFPCAAFSKVTVSASNCVGQFRGPCAIRAALHGHREREMDDEQRRAITENAYALLDEVDETLDQVANRDPEIIAGCQRWEALYERSKEPTPSERQQRAEQQQQADLAAYIDERADIRILAAMCGDVSDLPP